MIKAPMHIDAIILAFYITRNMKLYEEDTEIKIDNYSVFVR